MALSELSSSLWSAITPPIPAIASLQQDMQFDCVIIGGGFTGLNAAWHLMKRGVHVCVLDAYEPGWGASGRNGGMAVLRYKHGWSTLARKFGNEQTKLLYDLVFQAVAGLEENVQELGLDGGFKRYGHITAAYTQGNMQTLEEDVQWLAAQKGDREPLLLSQHAMRDAVGTMSYQGGYLDKRAGGVNPLAYAREFAQALQQRGLALFAHTPVEHITRQDNYHCLHTPGGTVRARHMLVATNAYTSMHAMPAGLAERIIPVTTSVIATQRIPDDIYASILPGEELVTDMRHLVNYFRRVPGNRVLFGGRGSLTGREKQTIYTALHRQLHALYPALKEIPVEYHWSGKVAVTLDDFPHLGGCGASAYFAMGYGGRGVALTHLLGRMLAERVMGEHKDIGPMGSNLVRIPFHGWRLPAMNVVASYYRLRDVLKV